MCVSFCMHGSMHARTHAGVRAYTHTGTARHCEIRRHELRGARLRRGSGTRSKNILCLRSLPPPPLSRSLTLPPPSLPLSPYTHARTSHMGRYRGGATEEERHRRVRPLPVPDGAMRSASLPLRLRPPPACARNWRASLCVCVCVCVCARACLCVLMERVWAGNWQASCLHKDVIIRHGSRFLPILALPPRSPTHPRSCVHTPPYYSCSHARARARTHTHKHLPTYCSHARTHTSD